MIHSRDEFRLGISRRVLRRLRLDGGEHGDGATDHRWRDFDRSPANEIAGTDTKTGSQPAAVRKPIFSNLISVKNYSELGCV